MIALIPSLESSRTKTCRVSSFWTDGIAPQRLTGAVGRTRANAACEASRMRAAEKVRDARDGPKRAFMTGSVAGAAEPSRSVPTPAGSPHAPARASQCAYEGLRSFSTGDFARASATTAGSTSAIRTVSVSAALTSVSPHGEVTDESPILALGRDPERVVARELRRRAGGVARLGEAGDEVQPDASRHPAQPLLARPARRLGDRRARRRASSVSPRRHDSPSSPPRRGPSGEARRGSRRLWTPTEEQPERSQERLLSLAKARVRRGEPGDELRHLRKRGGHQRQGDEGELQVARVEARPQQAAALHLLERVDRGAPEGAPLIGAREAAGRRIQRLPERRPHPAWPLQKKPLPENQRLRQIRGRRVPDHPQRSGIRGEDLPHEVLPAPERGVDRLRVNARTACDACEPCAGRAVGAHLAHRCGEDASPRARRVARGRYGGVGAFGGFDRPARARGVPGDVAPFARREAPGARLAPAKSAAAPQERRGGGNGTFP